MTILPKKKEGEESDSEGSGEASPSPPARPSLPPATLGGPSRSPDSSGGTFLPSSDGYYHRHYEYSSSGESSPELPVLSKHPPLHTPHTSHPSPPASGPPAPSRERGESEPGTPPYYSGYNSAEEYEGTHRPFFDLELERQFEQALKKSRGMIIHRMKPDGACLFRAVADQVYGDQDMHSVVRNHTMDYMLKNADYFSQFVTEDFEQYINRKRSDHSYGNNLEMQAMAEMYNRAIEVHQYSIDPINIFFGMYKTDNAPIRLSYHSGVHYNSVVDPYTATVGVGLGLAGHKPGLADKMLVGGALRESETLHLEQALLQDRLHCSDRDTTYEALEEAVARESYLTWLREQEMRTRSGQHSVESTSAACVSGSCTSSYHPLPPPINTLSSSPPSPSHRPEITHHPHTLIPSSASPLTPSTKQQPVAKTTAATTEKLLSKATTALHASSSEPKLSSLKGLSRSVSQRNSSSSSLHGLRVHNRWATPSPTGVPRRSSSLGSHHGSARTSPYVSPRTSPHGSRRGSPRNSYHCSPTVSPYHSPRNSIHGSPSPHTASCNSPTASAAASIFKYHSPKALSVSGRNEKPPAPGNLATNKNMNSSRAADASSTSKNKGPSSSREHSSPPAKSRSSPSPHSSSQAPPPALTPDFESGRVLDQLPFEYSSFLDLPPSAFGLSEWEDDRVLAAVLAASQQEYLQGLKQSSRGGAESL